MIILFCLLFSSVNLLFAQSVADSLYNPTSEAIESPTLITETIQNISPTKRIFIISNSSNAYFNGDYISIIHKNNLVARAIVAKTQDNNSGIKIVRIDSSPLWKELRKGLSVQILRGDDTYFRKKLSPLADGYTKINEEEDLYDETTFLTDDINVGENKDRAIKTDNIITINYAWVGGVDDHFKPVRYQQPLATWAYQAADNIWAEISYGQSVIRDFPGLKVDTALNNFIFKLKYCIPAPFYSFFKPYIGYQMIRGNSPGAGVNASDESKAENEKKLVDAINADNFIVGATVLKRLVPGWFFRADLGLDILSFGFGLEF